MTDQPYASTMNASYMKTNSFKKRSFLEIPLRREMQ